MTEDKNLEEGKDLKKGNLLEEDAVMDLGIEELSEETAQEVQATFRRFMDKYKEEPERDAREWLWEQLKIELPEKKEEEVRLMADEIVASVEGYGKDLQNLNQACRKGMTKEAWFAEKIQDSAKGMAVGQFGDYLYGVDNSLEQANLQMMRTVMRADGGISQSLNLDGFIAEQYHVNSFNAKAALADSPYRARVCVPEHGYAENSVDVMIDNIQTNEKGVERYQFKFGKDAEATVRMLRNGNYNNQRLVVPFGQAEEVKKAFPNKSVTDCIGGTQKVSIQSEAATKEQMKQLQEEAQLSGKMVKMDWNSYQTTELARGIGKQAGQAGIQAAFMGVGMNLARKIMRKEKIEADEVVKTALETGTDAGVKCAAGGALKVVSEKGALTVLPPGTPAGTIAKIACVGIENVKTLWKVAKGEMTMSEAMEHMGRSSVSMYAGLSASAVGAGIGAAALSVIPIVGPVIGGVVGGMAGYMAGSKIGEKIYEGAKSVVKKSVGIVKSVAAGVGKVVGKVFGGIRNLLPF